MFTGNKKISIDKSLYAKLEEAAGKRGYSSTEEMITHILEKGIAEDEDSLDSKEAEKQLRGLGYIN